MKIFKLLKEIGDIVYNDTDTTVIGLIERKYIFYELIRYRKRKLTKQGNLL